jgi:hypothetical protein
VLCKIVTVAGEVKSYAVAARVLRLVGEISVSARHVNRLTEEVGGELQRQRDRQTEDYLHHRRPPVTAPAPEIAVVALDGGRVRTRQPGQGPGVHGQGWKEDKVACLLAMEGESFEEDPHPQPPRCFLDAPQVDELVRQVQSRPGPRQEGELPRLEELGLAAPADGGAAERAPVEGEEADRSPEAPWPPRRAEGGRSCVATMRPVADFGKMVAAEAWRRNFPSAPRGALVGDGSAWIWKLHGKWFGALTPVTDFVHVLSYLYVTASVLTDSVSQRWQWYVGWMTLCWQGKVGDVLEELSDRLGELGACPGGGEAPATDPREVLKATRTYLRNNRGRMDYAEYRKRGLPVTSGMVESLIKEINYRVKGTEKFWDHPEGAEAILQVRAALLSDDDRLAEHVHARPGSATRRHARRAAA